MLMGGGEESKETMVLEAKIKSNSNGGKLKG